MSSNITRELIIEKLSTVYDPEIPVNIWELGLIYEIEFTKPTEVIIHMTLTAPGCPIADEIVQQVHDVVMEVEGIESATVNLVFEPAWTPERMSEVAKLELGFEL
jgi:FeS assembly SUF system protein